MNSDRFPMMVYRAPGPELVHGVRVETRIVDSEDDLDSAQDEGWYPTAPAADDALQAARQADADERAAAVREQERLEADAAAAAIRAPLEAEIEALKAKVATAAQDLADERAAHASTKAAQQSKAKAKT